MTHARIRFHEKPLRYIASAPFIYGMFIPLLILDVCAEIYHRVCFPLYGLPLVDRSEYIRIADRLRLAYLTPLERIHCAYCGYGNGLLRYVATIAARTEQHFCSIRHADHGQPDFHAGAHHTHFVPYDDEASYHTAMGEIPIKKNPLASEK